MTLSDGDVALLARQAVDLFAPDIEIDIVPEDPVDPYRWGAQAWLVWPLIDDRRSVGIRVAGSASPSEALAHLLDQLSEYGSATKRHWGVPFPSCPGHGHPADVTAEDGDVVLRCPDTGDEVGRIRPDVAP
ncbi:MAG: hypothetical protein QOH52_4695 [Pseudonocardiales bacterium]|jgi:hypothetical protein|nr:hypothetical protein [Pseudonocardiales bacterium]